MKDSIIINKQFYDYLVSNYTSGYNNNISFLNGGQIGTFFCIDVQVSSLIEEDMIMYTNNPSPKENINWVYKKFLEFRLLDNLKKL